VVAFVDDPEPFLLAVVHCVGADAIEERR